LHRAENPEVFENAKKGQEKHDRNKEELRIKKEWQLKKANIRTNVPDVIFVRKSNYFQRTECSLHVTIIHRHAILEYDGLTVPMTFRRL
jgi:hypothetical protein